MVDYYSRDLHSLIRKKEQVVFPDNLAMMLNVCHRDSVTLNYRLQNLGLMVVAVLSFVSPAFPQQSDYFRGDLSRPAGSDVCNPCVEDVISAVETLRDHGEALGFNWGDSYPPVEGAGTQNHWQGIQRLPFGNNESPHLVLSSSHRAFVLAASGLRQISGPSHLAVVELATQIDDGFRLGSNRLEAGKLVREVAPVADDRILRSHIITTEYDHPGGIQMIGRYLLIGSDGNISHGRNTALFTLWEMDENLSPRDIWQGGWELPERNANSVGIVRLDDGSYLMLRALADAKDMEFYILSPSLEQHPKNYHDAQPWDRWHYSELKTRTHQADGSLDRNWADLGSLFGDAGYQCTNLVTECETGEIYLIATHGRRPESIGGADFVDAYLVEVPLQRPDPDIAGEGVIITKVAKRQMYPEGNAGVRQADLQAAAGVYVSPDNKLYVYASEHGVTGDGGFVHMIEFAPREARSRADRPEDAWVELYAGYQFKSRSVVLDYADRYLRDYDNFHQVERFDNVTSSLIYAIPPGHSLRLYADPFRSGAYFDLIGSGNVVHIPDLREQRLSDGRDIDNTLSSAEWITSVTTLTSAGEDDLPASFGLSQNYPNPFNGQTVIRYDVPQSAEIAIEIYNMSGQLIRALVEAEQNAGSHFVEWDGKDEFGFDVASGTYLYRLKAGEELVLAKRLTLVR